MTVLRPTLLLLLALSALSPAFAASGSGEKPLYTPEQMAEIREIAMKQFAQTRKENPANAALQKEKPIVETLKDSLALNGTGVPEYSYGGITATPIQCQDGTLYYYQNTDFDQRYWYFHFDPTHGFAQQQKETLDALAPYMTMKSMTPDLRQRFQSQLDAMRQARTPADLDYVQTVAQYAYVLTGNNALTPAQLDLIQTSLAQHQKDIDELKKLVLAHSKAPDDAAINSKLILAAERYSGGMQSSIFQGKFFTLGQQHALGMDAPAGSSHHVGASSSASASASSGSAEEVAKLQAESEARQQAFQKKVQTEAKVKFTLKGTGATGSMHNGLDLADGMMWVEVTGSADGNSADYLFYYDQSDPWKTRREDWKKAYSSSSPADVAMRDCIDKSASSTAFQWAREVETLRAATHTVPPDVEQRLAVMIKEMGDASAVMLKAYDEVAAKPADPVLQRKMFEAFRDAFRIYQRNNTLCDRNRDYNNVNTSVPWLLTLDQADAANAGRLTTSSEMNSSSDGASVAISARPAGDKQYVGINANRATLGGLATKVEEAAQRYYHNHKLKLNVDAAVSDKPLKGMVEGKSAEELFQSLAQRAGASLVKDEKNPDAYTLKL